MSYWELGINSEYSDIVKQRSPVVISLDASSVKDAINHLIRRTPTPRLAHFSSKTDSLQFPDEQAEETPPFTVGGKDKGARVLASPRTSVRTRERENESGMEREAEQRDWSKEGQDTSGRNSYLCASH